MMAKMVRSRVSRRGLLSRRNAVKVGRLSPPSSPCGLRRGHRLRRAEAGGGGGTTLNPRASPRRRVGVNALHRSAASFLAREKPPTEQIRIGLRFFLGWPPVPKECPEEHQRTNRGRAVESPNHPPLPSPDRVEKPNLPERSKGVARERKSNARSALGSTRPTVHFAGETPHD